MYTASDSPIESSTMSSRAPKRVRAGSATGKSSRGVQSRKGYRELAPNEPAQSSPDSRTIMTPRAEALQSPSGRNQKEQAPSMPPAGKMLLPPLPKSRTEYSASPRTDKSRTSHACNGCRKAKAKCSGGQPCEKCRTEDKECMYGDGKRDKERK